ncbi:bifunctional metallophosphatase/5'-nucleotidase [Paenisporosarcina cavernae]|nr:bifunctional UDP-sugar hydrolase/5'-nucleotidase [Paenisporosarcina cavernae]
MKQTLTILHTNDVHASYAQFVRQASYIKKRKQELEVAGEAYLLIDAGDHLDMSVDECLATRGSVHLEMLEELQYDAMTVGNNELIRVPPEEIRELSKSSSVAWLLANIKEADGSVIGGMKPSLLIEKAGIQIGIIGTSDQFEDLYENKYGYRNEETVSVIQQQAEQLREQGAQLILHLSHLGFEEDRRIAKELVGFVDIVVGGHSHTVVETPVMQDGVYIAQAGSLGNYVGELQVELEDGKLGLVEGYLKEIDEEVPEDPAMLAIWRNAQQETATFLGEKLTVLETALSHEEVLREMATSLQGVWSADIGLMYGGGFLGGLDAGVVTRGDIFSKCRSMHSPIVMELRGDAIISLIRDHKKPEYMAKPIYGNGFRPQGTMIGTLGFSGVTWDDMNGEISNVRIGEESLEETRIYTVGTGTPMLYEEVCGYPGVRDASLVDIKNRKMVKDVFLEYCRVKGNV